MIQGDQVHSNHHHHNDMEASIKDTATHKDTDAAAPDAAAAHPPAAHAHACTSSLTAQRWLGPGGAGSAMAGVRAYVTAYTMELGCIFHRWAPLCQPRVARDNLPSPAALRAGMLAHARCFVPSTPGCCLGQRR